MVAQEPSLHLVPSSSNAGSISIASTANSLGLHDAMRFGTRSLAADVAPKHPLQNRLEGVRHPPSPCARTTGMLTRLVGSGRLQGRTST